MKTYNRLITFTKRIFSYKTYLIMLFCILAMTVTYKLLPAKSKETDIKVYICYAENNAYTSELTTELNDMNSVYSFVFTDSKDELLKQVKSEKAECGYYLPKGFFDDYIAGNSDKNPLEVYVVPSTTLSSTIGETIFSKIIKITAPDILTDTVGNSDLNADLIKRLDEQLHGSEIFTLESAVSGSYDYRDIIYHINIPIFESTLLFLIISSLLGLLLFLRDEEKNIYITLTSSECFGIKLLSILTAAIPMLIIGFTAVFITYGSGIELGITAITAIASVVFSALLGLVIKKSTLLSKVLPIVSYIAIMILFTIQLL